MKIDGYNVVTEAIDESGNERSRFIRFKNKFMAGLKGGLRVQLMSLKIWLWPDYLWSDAVNLAKLISRIGKNQEFYIDSVQLMQAAANGKFKTGKEFNNAIQKVMAKHNLRKQRLFDHVEL